MTEIRVEIASMVIALVALLLNQQRLHKENILRSIENAKKDSQSQQEVRGRLEAIGETLPPLVDRVNEHGERIANMEGVVFGRRNQRINGD